MKKNLLNTILFLGGITLMAHGCPGGDFLYSFFGGFTVIMGEYLILSEASGRSNQTKNLVSGSSFLLNSFE